MRPWRHQSGGVRDAQLRWAAERFSEAPAGALRVAAMHHQLIGAPWRTRKKPVARRNHVLAALLDAGAELILSGHTHQGAVAERHEFEGWSEGNPRVAVSTAPGLGQPRPSRRGEARGLLVYDGGRRGAADADVRVARRRVGPDGGSAIPSGPRPADLAESEPGADRKRDRRENHERRERSQHSGNPSARTGRGQWAEWTKTAQFRQVLL